MFPANVRLDWKVIASTNTLAYLASSTVLEEKCFITLTPDHFQSATTLLEEQQFSSDIYPCPQMGRFQQHQGPML